MEAWDRRSGGPIVMPPRPSFRRRIVADVIEKIRAGIYQPGQELPTQQQMADTYGCSLEPVKAALDELEIRGYVQGHQGRRTYVTENPPIEKGDI